MALKKHSTKIPVFVICHGEDIATNYVRYIENSKLYDSIEAINYTEEWRSKSFQTFVDNICDLVNKTNNNQRVIFFADISPLTEIGEYVSRRLNISVETIAPLSLPLILNTINVLENPEHHFEDRNRLQYSQPNSTIINEKYLSDTSQVLINKIANSVLDQSLIFLNPHKTTAILLTVLLETLKKLD